MSPPRSRRFSRRGSRSHVLVIDDDPSVRRALRRFFVAHGAGIALAENAEEALRALDRASFDLVVARWLMPRMAGLILLDRLVRIGHEEPARVALVTTSDPRSARLDALRARGVTVLETPLRADGLAALLPCPGGGTAAIPC